MTHRGLVGSPLGDARFLTLSKIINGPDGTPHHLVSCSYIESCYESATEVCGGKYKIVNTSNEVSGDAQSTSSTTNLLVKCSK